MRWQRGAGVSPVSIRSRAGSSTIRVKSGVPSPTSSRKLSPRPGLGRAELAAIGLTNQRETVVLWDRKDRRTR